MIGYVDDVDDSLSEVRVENGHETPLIHFSRDGSKKDILDQTASFASLTSSSTDVCRICHCEADPQHPLISPCSCSGTLKYVHQHCLQQWIKSANTKSCELCKLEFRMTATVKPFRKWQKLEMTKVERRKIICSVTFHIIAITCVVWSLYVLIERTMEEIKLGNLEWPFWTKLVVVGIGFTGGLVFMYIQCKMYYQLCRRWRAYNRVIYVQNCPENIESSAKSSRPSLQLSASASRKNYQ